MAALKELLNPAAVKALGAALQRVYPKFPEAAFVKDGLKGLSSLELKGRVQHLARTMKQHLPGNLKQALSIVVKAAKSEANPRGLDGFRAWPLTQFVEEFGQEEPAASLAALKAITPDVGGVCGEALPVGAARGNASALS